MDRALIVTVFVTFVFNPGQVAPDAVVNGDATGTVGAPSSAVITKASDELKAVPTKIAPPEGTQAVFDSQGYPCILSEARATFKITFPAKLGKKGSKRGTKTVSVTMPDYLSDGKSKTSGYCESNEAIGNITYTWGKDDHFQLTITFEKGKAGRNEVWRIKELAFKYDRSDAIFNGTTFLDGGQPLVVSNPKKLRYQVSHEMSLECDSDKKFDLSGKSKDDGSVVATIHHMKFHPFLATSGGFGEVYWCRPEFDERVPIAVGSVMAVMTVLTVAGYALFRKFRPKKADYDTME